MSKFKVGDVVWVKPNEVFGTISSCTSDFKGNDLWGGESYQVDWKGNGTEGWGWFKEDELSFTSPVEPSVYPTTEELTEVKATISDGGPSSYYDWPSDWNTLNDFIEDKSVNQWKGFSFHLGNIVKAVTRWGDKSGTTEEYDAKKIIYSGCRVLKMIVGKEKLREYLQSLLDDQQFK